VSSRRTASVVVALAVASLAATSLAAMLASSELLVESFDRRAPSRPDPQVPDLSTVGTIQDEPPKRERAGRPPGRSRTPATKPPAPQRQPATSQPVDHGGGGVVLATQRRPTRHGTIVARQPVLGPPPPPPAPRPVRPPRPQPPQPEPPLRRWADRKRHLAGRVFTPPRSGGHRPRAHKPADPDRHPGGRTPCPHPRWDESERGPQRDRHGWDQGRDRSSPDHPRRDETERRPNRDRHGWDQGRDRSSPDHPGQDVTPPRSSEAGRRLAGH
jgi:hypothetical protein